ncbi:hypothetical protein TcasGA2_TC004620 [Tribolium castaneum]|uniref:Uncharacterized protein n=1 Tax=Tribolium castaneum TaxID=7070 RepID=D6W7X5_TRICA|nr:hypothetical protein TcasGA2_TC004620 [Tribolium castaneum]
MGDIMVPYLLAVAMVFSNTVLNIHTESSRIFRGNESQRESAKRNFATAEKSRKQLSPSHRFQIENLYQLFCKI